MQQGSCFCRKAAAQAQHATWTVAASHTHIGRLKDAKLLASCRGHWKPVAAGVPCAPVDGRLARLLRPLSSASADMAAPMEGAKPPAALGPRIIGRLTPELILRSPQYMNPVNQYEIDLRANRIAAIENLGATEVGNGVATAGGEPGWRAAKFLRSFRASSSPVAEPV